MQQTFSAVLGFFLFFFGGGRGRLGFAYDEMILKNKTKPKKNPTLFWNNFRFTRNYRNSREFLSTLYSASPSDKILRNHRTLAKTRKVACNDTFTQHRPCSDVARFCLLHLGREERRAPWGSVTGTDYVQTQLSHHQKEGASCHPF